MENLILKKLVTELSHELRGHRVEHVRGVPPMSLVVEFEEGEPGRLTADADLRTSRALLICLSPEFPCLLTVEGELLDSPSDTLPEGFVRETLAVLQRTTLEHVEQHALDRIARLTFSAREGKERIVLWLELFGRRPLAVLAKAPGNKILACSREGVRSAAGNIVRAGVTYAPPSAGEKISVEKLTPGMLDSLLGQGKGDSGFCGGNADPAGRALDDIGAVLSRNIEGLSPQAAREIIAATLNRPPTAHCPSPETVLSGLKKALTGPAENISPAVRMDRRSPSRGFGLLLFPFGAKHCEMDPGHALERFNETLEAIRFGFAELCRWHRSLAAARLKGKAASLVERLARLRELLGEDLASAERAGQYRRMGELILANMKTIRRGTSSVELKDIHEEGETLLRVPLDPAISPPDNANKYFKKAKKSGRALELVRKRVASLEHSIEVVQSFLDGIPVEVGASEFIALSERLDQIKEKVSRELAPGRGGARRSLKETILPEPGAARPAPGSKVRRAASAGPTVQGERRKETFNPRVFLTSDGHTVIVGRNNRENDYVTHRVARPEDLWFHASSMPGSHVILRKKGKSEPSRRAIEEAASIAAYFSKGRTSSAVPVTYTRKKYVHKPRGARPGTATCARDKLVMARPVKPGPKPGA